LALAIALSAFNSCVDKNIPVIKEEETADEEFEPGKTVSLGYYIRDSLNPFYAASLLNTGLTPLVYDSLYSLDEKYMPVPVIAASYILSEGKLKVTLLSDVLFSDGTQLTSDDVAYSFNTAKNSNRYADTLSGFLSAEKESGFELVFNLAKHDSYAVNLLTFPIVKYGTGEEADDIPVGSGPYRLFDDDDGKRFSVNPYNREKKGEIGEVRLYPISVPQDTVYGIENGFVDAAADDLSGGKFTFPGVNHVKYPQNNLVFIAFNSSVIAFSDSRVRRAISYCVNRREIASAAFLSFAKEAYTPFNPAWEIYAEANMFNDISAFTDANMEKTEFSVNYLKGAELLEAAGFASVAKSGARTGTLGYMEYTMLINDDNQFKLAAARSIAESLEKVNIKIEIKALPWNDYVKAVNDENFDMCLEEIKLNPNMNFSVLIPTDSASPFHIKPQKEITDSYRDFLNGMITIDTFIIDFFEHMPFIPIVFRDGALYYSGNITPGGKTMPPDYLSALHNWNVK